MPVQDEWQIHLIGADEATTRARALDPGPSGGLVDIDRDAAGTVAVAPAFCPRPGDAMGARASGDPTEVRH
jgi:hypothetical protein